jgi:Ca-activated chloride channel family protein
MNNEFKDEFNLDDLKSAMNAAPPAPDKDAKAKNIALATKNFADLQGLRDSARHTTRPTKWTGVKDMLNTLTSRAGLTVTTAIVAAGFMIATPRGRDILNLAPPPRLAQPTPLEAAALDPAGSVSVAPALADVTTDDANVTALTDPIMEMAPAVMLSESGGREEADSAISNPATAAPLSLTRAAPTNDLLAEGMALGQVASAPEPFVADIFEPNTETFANDAPNPLKITSEEPVSTFSIDVDTRGIA